jgi:IMP dehydrogenase
MNKLASIPEGLTFDDVLLVPRFSNTKSRSGPEVDTTWRLTEKRFGENITYKFLHPIIPANMDTITELKMALQVARQGGLPIIHRRMTIRQMTDIILAYDEALLKDKMWTPLGVSVGSVHSDKERIDSLIDDRAAAILCVDIAHGHSIHMKDTLEYIRKKGFRGPVIAGNVVTHKATKDLYEWGASMVKVGVGPGSACTTRIKTGCGYPQLSAIVNCASPIYYGSQPNTTQVHIPIIADGGIREPGDAGKALAAGATAVMVGGMLAGTDCVPGWIPTSGEYVNSQGQPSEDVRRIPFRGMASKEARAAVGEPETNAEGKAFTVQCKSLGSTQQVISYILEGIQSAMSYTGCTTLEQLRTETEFVRISSTAENHPHFKG